MSTKQNISYDTILVEKLFFEIQGIGVNFSMTRVSWRKEQKNWKVWKILKMYNIKIIKTIGFKLTASGNITHCRFLGNITGNIRGLWDRAEFYGYLKIKKQIQQTHKN